MRKYQYYDTGADGDRDAYSNNWEGQTFTPETTHLLGSVKLKLFKVGSPGTIMVSIRATAAGVPAGGDLCVGTIDDSVITEDTNGEWYEITMGNGYQVAKDTQYAIVVRAAGGDASNKVSLLADTSDPTYAGGTHVDSSDSGAEWNTYSGVDLLFEEWGVGEASPTTVVWGNLLKSQISAEKIEEAITRMIQDHEDDPDAHLEIGESLQSHKASEIIDHVAESIIEDKIKDGEITGVKITNDQIIGKDFRTAEDVGAGQDGVKFNSDGIEMWQSGERKVNVPKSGDAEFLGRIRVNGIGYNMLSFYTDFRNMDGLATDGTGGRGSTTNEPWWCYLTTGTTEDDRRYIEFESSVAGIFWTNGAPFFEMSIYIGPETTTNMIAGLGINPTTPDDTYYGAGFEWVASEEKLYAIWYKNQSKYTQEITGFSWDGVKRLRVEKHAASLKFYVNNELKYEATANLPDNDNFLFYATAGIQTTAAAAKSAVIADLLLGGDKVI